MPEIEEIARRMHGQSGYVEACISRRQLALNAEQPEIAEHQRRQALMHVAELEQTAAQLRDLLMGK